MNRINSKWIAVTVGVLAALSAGRRASAQSVDALLDKLVEKQILTTKEASDLREEVDQNFSKAYQVKSGMPDWVTSLKLNGDFRGRFESFQFDKSDVRDRERFRYRARLGVTALLLDRFEVGLRFTSSDPASDSTGALAQGGDPISGNTTFQNNGSKKFVYFDLAYGKWTAVNNKRVTDSITIGKMENPFVFSDMVFDNDYTPEGVANNFTYNLNDHHALKVNAGAFAMDEISTSSRDPFYWGVQGRWDAVWSPKILTSVGLAGLAISHKDKLGTDTVRIGTSPSGDVTTTVPTVPNVNVGNDRASGVPAHNFYPVVADAGFTYNIEKVRYYNGVFPIRVYGEFMHNPGAPDENSAWMAGIGIGKAGKRGTWAVDYRYKYLEGNAWYEEFTDSDYGALYPSDFAEKDGRAGRYGGGTNVKGHVIRAAYSPFDSLTLQVSYWLTELIENPSSDSSDTGRLQLDAVWKF